MIDRKKIFIIIFIVTIICFSIIKSPVSLIPLIYIILAILVSYIYLYIIKNTCEIKMSESGIKEFNRLSSQTYFIDIINKSFLVFPKMNLKIALKNKAGYLIKKYEYDFLLNPKEKKQLKVNVEFPHVGEYVFEIQQIKIYDIFDIFYLKIKTTCKEEIFVKPKKYDLDNLEIETIKPLNAVNFNVPTKMEGEVYDDIREYSPGDSMKSIHWKLSAHTNKYMTKILTTDAVNGITVYIDFVIEKNILNLEKLDIKDSLIELAYAIGLFAMKKDRQINYIYSNMNSPICSHTSTIFELEKTIFELSRCSNSENYPIEIILSEYGNSIMSLDNMAIITSNINEELINLLLEFKEEGKRILLFVISLNSNVKTISDNLFEVLIKKDIEFYIFESVKDLSLVMRGVEDA